MKVDMCKKSVSMAETSNRKNERVWHMEDDDRSQLLHTDVCPNEYSKKYLLVNSTLGHACFVFMELMGGGSHYNFWSYSFFGEIHNIS